MTSEAEYEYLNSVKLIDLYYNDLAVQQGLQYKVEQSALRENHHKERKALLTAYRESRTHAGWGRKDGKVIYRLTSRFGYVGGKSLCFAVYSAPGEDFHTCTGVHKGFKAFGIWSLLDDNGDYDTYCFDASVRRAYTVE